MPLTRGRFWRLGRRGGGASPITLADRARDSREWAEAARHYRTALARNPFNPPIWVQYGHMLRELGEVARAEAAYRKALEDAPAIADTHLQLGQVLKAQGRREAAAEFFLRALALDPRLDAAARELRGPDRSESRLASCREALHREAARPARRRGPVTLADRAMLVEDWGQAARLYRKVLARNPTRASIWAQYGHALREAGKSKAAETAYRRALAVEPGVADMHAALGQVLRSLGKTEEAQAAFLRAFELDAMRAEALKAYLELRRASDAPMAAAELAAVLAPRPDAVPAAAPPGAEPSEAGLLAAHGLAAEVGDIFDHFFYFYANPEVAEALGRPSRRGCLIHFCEVGVDRLLACHERFSFDVDFYVETYLEGLALPPELAYRLWLNSGRRLGWHPNRRNWVQSVLDIDEAALSRADLELYLNRAAHPQETWTEAFLRFVDDEAVHSQLYLPVTEDTADFFEAIARRLAGAGRDAEALLIFDRILFAVPGHRRAIIHRADALMRIGDVLGPLKIHERLINRHENTIWSYIHQANCYDRLGDPRKALFSLHAGLHAYPGNAQLKYQFAKIADEFLPRAWNQAVIRGMMGRYQEAQERLQDACEAVSSLVMPTGSLPNRPIRSVAIVGLLAVPQCRLYRIDQKVEHLRQAGFSVTVYDGEKNISEFLSEIYLFEVVIFYRLPAWLPLIFAIAKAKELGLLTFYDIDDFIFGERDYPDPIESFGGLIDRLDWVQLKMGAPFYKHAISLCDYGIASTTALADQMAKLVTTGKVFVHRNAFSRAHQLLASSPPQPRKSSRVTIFYGSGTKSHKGDFQELVEPALVEMVRRYGERIWIVLVGYHALSESLELIRDNLQWVDPIWDVEEYWSLLRSADINIAPLKDSSMNNCKSEIKWMEAAMFGIASIVSNTATYREVIEDGVDGIICATAEEWTSALNLLIHDANLRHRIGLEAWHRVRERYNINKMASNIAGIFQDAAPFSSNFVSKPTVLIVNVFYPPQALGGATRIVYDNVKYLAAVHGDEFRVEVFTTAVGSERDYEISCYLQDGVRVTVVNRPALAEIETRIIDDEMERIFSNFLDAVRPSVVHFHCIQRLSASVVAAARNRHIPYLITAHDGWWISDVQFLVDENDEVSLYDYSSARDSGDTRMGHLKPLLFGARNVLAVSEKFAGLYRQCGVPQVLAVPNGVSQLPGGARTQSADGRVRLGFVSGISRHKGYQLIKAALLGGEYRHLCLTVVDGSLLVGETRREVWGSTEVRFLPKFPESRVGELYGMLDVVLAPSVCIESFGLVTREALQCGCWVVASDRGSIGDCVTEGVDGFVIDVADPEGLIRVLRLIDRDPGRFLRPPPAPPAFRRPAEQAEELAKLYLSLIAASALAAHESARA